MLEYLFEAVLALGGTLDVAICSYNFPHSLAFLGRYFPFVAISHINLGAHENDRASSLRVPLNFWDPGVIDAGEGIPVNDRETENQDLTLLVGVGPKVFKVNLRKTQKIRKNTIKIFLSITFLLIPVCTVYIMCASPCRYTLLKYSRMRIFSYFLCKE